MKGNRALYPLFLDLKGQRCVVVGGGQVAARKAGSLLEAGADVTVIAPEWVEPIAEWQRLGKLKALPKRYEAGDTDGALLVFAATNDAAVNEAVARDAADRRQLVTVADRPERGSFVLPAVMRRGKLAIAVSTSGAGPSAAAKIARELEEVYGAPEVETALEFLSELRETAQARIADGEQRRRLFREAAAVDWPALIRRGDFASLRERLLACAQLQEGAAERFAALVRERG